MIHVPLFQIFLISNYLSHKFVYFYLHIRDLSKIPFEWILLAKTRSMLHKL